MKNVWGDVGDMIRGSGRRTGYSGIPRDWRQIELATDDDGEPDDDEAKPPTIAFHAAWIYMALMLMLFFGLTFYIGWGMRQESDEPLYALINFILNGDTKWRHRWGALIVLAVGLGILATLSVFNFIIPNHGIEWGCFAKEAKGPTDYTFFNHLEVWISGTHSCVFWFLGLLLLGMTTLDSLIFGSLLAFSSEAIFHLAQYITHFEDKHQLHNAAAARLAWPQFAQRLQNAMTVDGTQEDVSKLSDGDLDALLDPLQKRLAKSARALAKRTRNGEASQEDYRTLWNAAQDATLALHSWPLIKKAYTADERSMDSEGIINRFTGGKNAKKGKISGSFAAIATASRIAIWTIAGYAFAYTQRDFDNAQWASAIIVMLMDFGLVVKHISCFIYSHIKEPVGYPRSHASLVLMLCGSTISLAIPFVMAFFKEGDVPGAA